MQACNCGKPAADDPRSSGMCGDCYRADCEAGAADAIQMGENMRRYGCIDTPAELAALMALRPEGYNND